jgi:hypothetical protein
MSELLILKKYLEKSEMCVNIQETVKGITIDISLLEGMAGHYFNRIAESDQSHAITLKHMVAENPIFRRCTLDAAADAIIFSQLAITLTDDQEFSDALECCHDLSGSPLILMRISLFDEGLEIARESIEGDEIALSRADRRITIAHFRLSIEA